jgi:hypothetical protein
MTNKSDAAMERVHNLYMMQCILLDMLAQDLRDPDMRKEAQSTVREFKKLLDQADWRYMGGEDVLESLKTIPSEMTQKLKIETPRVSGKVKGRRK